MIKEEIIKNLIKFFSIFLIRYNICDLFIKFEIKSIYT